MDAGVDVAVDVGGDLGIDLGVDSGVSSVLLPTAACPLTPLSVPACSLENELPVYAFMVDCHYCSCERGALGCTANPCSDAGLPDPQTNCLPEYCGLSGVALPIGEEWVCDAKGSMFRSGCSPTP